MFGFWFWILTPLVLILVVAFVYDRRHEGVRINPQEDSHRAPTRARRRRLWWAVARRSGFGARVLLTFTSLSGSGLNRRGKAQRARTCPCHEMPPRPQ
jgi:hypothetical protein